MKGRLKLNSESQSKNKGGILNRINSPRDLKKLLPKELPILAAETRAFLIDNVTKNGGHLASNLGIVELTIALHRVFNTPEDHIVWDVGHQAYVHKLLTGRKGRFESLRCAGGLSGFTNRAESEHDCFGAGHSSTSLSAALGFAQADKLSRKDSYTVVVLGDGAFTGGMIHEALNNCDKDLNLIIIINENEMSISKNTGRFANSLASLRAKHGYFQTKKTTGMIIKKIPLIGNFLFEILRDIKKSFKNFLYGSNYFEDLGLYYIGPIDGNDESSVETVLREAKQLDESVVIHLKTKKGKGYGPAEQEPHLYHSLSPISNPKSEITFSTECGRLLSEKADANKDIVAITAAMSYGTGLESFRREHPGRFFDVGIAEEHALTFAAGLAAAGKRPVVAVYSTFLQRGFDNIIHDIALQDLPVVMCVDRAGLNTGDGATHHGIFDVAFLSGLPNVRIYTPATYSALKYAIDDAFEANCPCAIRYPSGSERDDVVCAFDNSKHMPAKLQKCKQGADFKVAIVAHGRMVSTALSVCDELERRGITCAVIMLERLTPYPSVSAGIAEALSEKTELLVFIEEEIRAGGMGMMLSDALKTDEIALNCRTIVYAINDPFVKCSKNMTYYEASGLDVLSLADKITGQI